MNDKAIFAAIRAALLDGFARAGLSSVEVARGYQPTSQGRANGSAIYMTKLFDQRFGHVDRKETYRPETDDFLHTERQQYESTFQMMATAEENPADPDGMTASDYANKAAGILQSDIGMAILAKSGLRPLRVTTVRNVPFENDKGQWEFTPSFDLVLTHHAITESVTPAAQTIQGKFA